MWGPGPWGAPVWGFWWIFPLIGLLICFVVVVAMVKFMGGRGFMCMGDHQSHADEREMELRRRIRELRDDVNQLKQSR